jgi:hypothetical protein
MDLINFLLLLIPEISFAYMCIIFIIAIIVGSVIGSDSSRDFFIWFAVVYVCGISLLKYQFGFFIAMILSKTILGYDAIYATSVAFSLNSIFETIKELFQNLKTNSGSQMSLLEFIPNVILLTTGSIGLNM